jgi:tetratricopeptide (TPR) repeat protein
VVSPSILPTTAHHEANFDSETQQANALFTSGRQLEALPLYEDLSRQDPSIALFAERHASCLFTKWSSNSANQNQQLAYFLQALNEMHRAQRLGDHSSQLAVLLSLATRTPMGAILTGIPLTPGYSYQGSSAAQATFMQAQAAFSAQKYDEAVKLYASANAQDPAFYLPALYAGDAYLRLKDYANAGVWYAKAIAIDPARETAYRYWGDALFKQGNAEAAKLQFENAFIAEPYNDITWNFLWQWSMATKTQLHLPEVHRPEFYLLNGKTDIDPKLIPETGDGHTSWFVYQHVRVAHGAPSLVQNTPPAGGTMANGDLSASGYLHTLAEEMEALNAMLDDIDRKLSAGTVHAENLEPSIRVLMQIRKDKMLECFTLLNNSDLGLRHDYPKYRDAHRDLLLAYIDKYLLAAQPASPKP